MKLLFIICFVLLAGITLFFVSSRPSLPSSLPFSTPTIIPTTTPIPANTLTYNNNTYAYYILGPISPNRVSLHTNLPEKQTSTTLKDLHNCNAIVSAGFYGKDDNHLGLFIEEGEEIRRKMNSSLFNGIVWKTTEEQIGITPDVPEYPMTFGLQTGPILIKEQTVQPLHLSDDEFARRIALGITQDGNFIWYGITGEKNIFSGPLLKDLPTIIQEINKKEHLSLSNAINLDGGNHSVMNSNSISLSELSPIGGIFCIKQ